jgi:hypothetical protein
MRDFIGCLYYVLVWPLKSAAAGLIDNGLVYVGLKRRTSMGAVWNLP